MLVQPIMYRGTEGFLDDAQAYAVREANRVKREVLAEANRLIEVGKRAAIDQANRLVEAGKVEAIRQANRLIELGKAEAIRQANSLVDVAVDKAAVVIRGKCMGLGVETPGVTPGVAAQPDPRVTKLRQAAQPCVDYAYGQIKKYTIITGLAIAGASFVMGVIGGAIAAKVLK